MAWSQVVAEEDRVCVSRSCAIPAGQTHWCRTNGPPDPQGQVPTRYYCDICGSEFRAAPSITRAGPLVVVALVFVVFGIMPWWFSLELYWSVPIFAVVCVVVAYSLARIFYRTHVRVPRPAQPGLTSRTVRHTAA